MATALTSSDRALNATDGKANFHRLTRLLVCGGITLLREVFDSIRPPVKLGDPAIKAKLQMLIRQKVLTQAEWNQLYPSPGVYGKSTDFDITLLFKLFRNICSLAPPGTGWDCLPNVTDVSLEADLTRIKCYRNEVYAHSKTMEISGPEFVVLWREIREALLRIAGSISNVKRDEWQTSIDAFLDDPLTPHAQNDRAELDLWYKNDLVVKDELEKLRYEMQEMKNIVIHIFAEDVPPWQMQANRRVLDFWQVVFAFKRAIDILIEYLRTNLGLDVVDSRPGSLLITVTCSSLEVLERLWEDYSTGHLGKVVQETLVTPEVLEELDLSDVKLKTIILEEEYKSLRKVLENRSDTLKQQRRDEQTTGDRDDNDESRGGDEKANWKHLAEELTLEMKHFGWLKHLNPDPLKQQRNVSRRTTQDSGYSFESPTADNSDDSDGNGESDEKSRDNATKMTGEITLAVFPPESKKRSSGYLELSFEPLLFMDYLPYWLRHDLIETLDSPYRLPNWRTLAEELGLEMRHIRCLEQLAPCSSPTDILLRMMEAQKSPLSELAETLRKLGRDDAASIIEEHLESLREISTTGQDTKR